MEINKVESKVFDVIVPIYNAEDTLERCLNSIAAQTFLNFNVIMIDDGSTDSSNGICSRYQETDKRFFLTTKENEGVGLARKKGLELAESKYLCFVDSDDIIKPNLLEDSAAIINKLDMDLIVFGYEKQFMDEAGGVIYQSISSLKHEIAKNIKDSNILELITGEGRLSLWNKIFKRSIIKDNHLTFPAYKRGEDMSFLLDYLSHCRTYYVNPVIYYTQVSSFSISKSDEDSMSNHIEIFSKLVTLSDTLEYGKKEKQKTLLSTFILWFSHIAPRHIDTNPELLFSEKILNISLMFKNSQTRKYLNEVSIADCRNTIEKMSLLFLKVKSPLLLLGLTRIKALLFDLGTMSYFRRWFKSSSNSGESASYH